MSSDWYFVPKDEVSDRWRSKVAWWPAMAEDDEGLNEPILIVEYNPHSGTLDIELDYANGEWGYGTSPLGIPPSTARELAAQLIKAADMVDRYNGGDD